MGVPKDVMAVLEEHFDECEWVVQDGSAWWRAEAAEDDSEPGWRIEGGVGGSMSVEFEHGWYSQSGECEDADSLRALMLGMVAAHRALEAHLAAREVSR